MSESNNDQSANTDKTKEKPPFVRKPHLTSRPLLSNDALRALKDALGGKK